MLQWVSSTGSHACVCAVCTHARLGGSNVASIDLPCRDRSALVLDSRGCWRVLHHLCNQVVRVANPPRITRVRFNSLVCK